MQLRDYQQDLVQRIREAYRSGFKCPLVRADTGAGKTVLFSYITQGASALGRSTMVVAHRKELITQISLSLAKFSVVHTVIAPPNVVRKIKVKHFKAFGKSFVKDDLPTMVGSVQTIVRRFAHISRPPDLIIMDEGHHVIENTGWGAVMAAYSAAKGLIVTATPCRTDRKGLGKGHGGYADTLIEGPSMAWLIENGYLSPYRVFTTRTPIDLTGVATRMGDYAKEQLAERVDRPTVVGDAVEHYKQVAAGMLAVVYCVSVQHSEHTAESFRQAGIPAAHFDGETDDDVREQIVSDFADGKIQVLCNVGLVTEGFDLASIAQKDVTIDCVIDLAPTQSLSLYMQKVGRCLRPRPGKTAIILDHAGNVLTHGLPDLEREWSLEGGGKKKLKADNDNEPDVSLTTCPQCFCIHPPAPQCQNCGHVYEAKPREIKHEDGELVEISQEQLEAMRKAKRLQQGQAQTVEELQAQGMSYGQASRIVQARAEKQALIDNVIDLLEAHKLATGQNSLRAFDVTYSEVRRMKPKPLKELRELILSKRLQTA